LGSIPFVLIGRQKHLRPICNQNIRIISELSDELFQQASFVIASGKNAYKAISAQRPCIVAGDRGYAGIIDSENFEIQYHSYFHGRAGGELGEYIPAEFLQSDIAFLQQSSFDEETKHRCFIVASKLQQKRQETLKQLKIILEKTVCSYHESKEKLEDLHLKLSDIYFFIPLQDKFAIVRTFSKKLYSIIEKEEMDIIKIFNKSICVQNAYLLFKENYSKENFLIFILDLIQEKILIIDDCH